MQETSKRKKMNFDATHQWCFSLLILMLFMFTGTSEAYEASLSPHYNDGDGTYTTTTREGQQVWIPDHYFYLRVPGFPSGAQSAYVEITYYDEPVGATIKLQYDSVSDAYTMSNYHTRSTGEGSMLFVKSYHRLDDPLFADRQNGGSDFRLNCSGFPIKSVILRDTPFSDPYAAYALSHDPPWLSPYAGPSRDDVNADTMKGKLVAGYQGWFRTPNDLNDEGFTHWGDSSHPTVDMWPDPVDYDPSSLKAIPGFITEGGLQGYVFSSADPAVVQKHFEWMRQYNIDGVYLQRFFTNSTAGAEPEWVLAQVREAAHLHGRVWAIEYDISGGNDTNFYDTITADWIWLVDEVGITSDSRYLYEQGKPVVVIWGAGIREDITQGPLNDLVDFLKDDPVYGGNYVVGCVKNTFPSEWDSHYARYDSIFAWMGSQQNVADHAAQYGINAQVHVWPGFSWHNLKQYVFPTSYTDRAGGNFFWGKISNGIDIIDPEAIFVGMFDEYDESTAVMPMSDDPPVVPNPEIFGHYITNDGSAKDWWMMLSGYAKETLCNQVPFSFTKPTESSLANRSNIGPELSVDLGTSNVSNLLYQEEDGDGATVGDIIAGVTCRRATQNYMYFDVDNTILYEVAAGEDVTIIVDYYDTSDGVDIGLQYDSVSEQWKVHPKSFTMSGSDHWWTVRFEIDDAYFGDRENGADFRLRSFDIDHNMNIARVRVILTESTVYAATVPYVVGQAQATAESNIVAAGLVVGEITISHSDTVPAGDVISQDPTGGSTVATGSSVDLVISTDAPCAGLADFNCNGIVGMGDLSYMAGVWLTDDSKADIAQPADGIVNLPDFSILAQGWLNNAPVAYWKLNETTGTVAEDDSPNGYDGTLMNMDDSDWVEGVYGNALDFDGLNDYVKISGYKGVTGTANRTCAAWIKTDSGDEILSWGGDGTGEKWTFRVQSGGLIRLEVSGGAIGGSTIVNDGLWHHVAAVFLNDGTPDVSDVKLYVDGIEESTTSAGQAINTASSYNVKIGVYGSSGRYFNGLIDDVRIYNRALSQDEIEIMAGL